MMGITQGATIPLATTVCPNCGYSLLGLDVYGVCPECGHSYNQSELILYGHARGRYETALTARGTRLVWIIFASTWFLVFQIPSFSRNPRGALIALAAAIAPIAYMLYRRKSIRHPGRVQVRLSDAGCVQYNDLAGDDPLRELFRSQGWTVFAAAVLFALSGLAVKGIATIWAWLLLLLGLVGLPISWNRCRKVRLALRDLAPGSIAELNRAYHPRLPWSDVARFWISNSGPNRHRLGIERKEAPGAWYAPECVVDAEISCTDEELEQLRTRINGWIATSRSVQNGISLPSS